MKCKDKRMLEKTLTSKISGYQKSLAAEKLKDKKDTNTIMIVNVINKIQNAEKSLKELQYH